MKKVLLFLASAIISLPLFARWDGSSSPWTQGNGTQNNPYQISTPNQLAYLSDMVSAGYDYEGQYFLLTDDISLSNQSWLPIGDNSHPFKGIFNGGGHNIDSIIISNSNYSLRGLFGKIENGIIMNLSGSTSLINTPNGYSTAGGLVAYIVNSSMKNCSCTTSSVVYHDTIGGLIGSARDSRIHGCKASATITGGFVGAILRKILIHLIDYQIFILTLFKFKYLAKWLKMCNFVHVIRMSQNHIIFKST